MNPYAIAAIALVVAIVAAVLIHWATTGNPPSDYLPTRKPPVQKWQPKHDITPERANFRADKISVPTRQIDPRLIQRLLAEGRDNQPPNLPEGGTS